MVTPFSLPLPPCRCHFLPYGGSIAALGLQLWVFYCSSEAAARFEHEVGPCHS